MMKSFFKLCLWVAIVTFTATLASCDKDGYVKSPNRECYYKIVDSLHICTMDNDRITVDPEKEIENGFQIRVEGFTKFLTDSPLVFEDGEEVKEIDLEEVYNSDGDEGVKYTFRFNGGYKTSIRIRGLKQMCKDALGNERMLLCLDDLTIGATLETIEHQDDPFIEEYVMTYYLMAGVRTISVASHEILVSNDAQVLFE